MHHNSRFGVTTSEGYTVSVSASGAAAAAEDWKRRDAPKHAPYLLEPVSPPDNHHANRNNNSSNRRYSGVSGVSGVGGVGGGVNVGGGVLTAFDYVTNRIVEVMRSDADERAKPLAFPPTAYAYPYSALNVATPAQPPAMPAPHTEAPGSSSSSAVAPEPAPLMSAQYEPLSDED
ncbi:uncharacterized protein LOC114352541 [Ostrinia furnacalis]|nr:uncharacterized protein LOC114352541 [Ostrinia furnacalis]